MAEEAREGDCAEQMVGITISSDFDNALLPKLVITTRPITTTNAIVPLMTWTADGMTTNCSLSLSLSSQRFDID
jgi:hypothetical protein